MLKNYIPFQMMLLRILCQFVLCHEMLNIFKLLLIRYLFLYYISDLFIHLQTSEWMFTVQLVYKGYCLNFVRCKLVFTFLYQIWLISALIELYTGIQT